jgi:predicted oxidoreductase
MSLSRIISGTMNWGSWGANYSSTEISELIKCAYENGINTFDHADIYGGYTTEEAFGEGFKLSGIDRKEVIFISKCGIMYPCEKLKIDVKHYDYSRGHIIKSVENSLKNLNTNYLDCLLLHRPSPIMDIHEISDTIDFLIDKKMIKSFGVSNFTVSQMSLLEKYIKVSYNQINFSLTNYEPMFDGTLDYMQINNIKPMAYSPLGNYFTSNNKTLLNKVKKMCLKYSCHEDEVLLSWILSHNSGILPVIGSSKEERIARSSKAEKINIELIDWFELLEASMGKRLP